MGESRDASLKLDLRSVSYSGGPVRGWLRLVCHEGKFYVHQWRELSDCSSNVTTL